MKNKFLRGFAGVLAAAMVVSALPATGLDVDAAAKKVAKGTKITAKPKSVSVVAGSKKTVVISLSKKQSKKFTLKVKSSNAKIATATPKTLTVKKGKTKATKKITIKGVKAGKTNVKVSVKGAKTLSIPVTVTAKKVKLTGVTLNTTSPKAGETLTAAGAPANATGVTYSWTLNGTAAGTGKTFTVPATAKAGDKIVVTAKDNSGTTKTATATVAESKMTAKQTGAKEITVDLPTAGAGTETYTVTRNNTEQTIASVVYNGTKAVITLDNNIKEAEYTVKSSNTALKEATFTGEEAKLTKIEIADELIFNKFDSPNYIYTTKVATLDQFGGDFAVADFDTKTCSAGTATYNKGVLTVNAGSSELILGTQHTISLVSGTVVGTQTVKVSAASVVNKMTVGELTMTESEAKINKTGRIDSDDLQSGDKYYFPITAEDQYGNALTADQLNEMTSAGSLIVSPDSDLGTGVFYATGKKASKTIFSSEADGTIAMFVKGDGSAYGAGIITLVSTSGNVTSATANISQDERIESLTCVPTGTLKKNGTIEATVTAKTNYDEDVDLYEDVTYTNSGTATLTMTYVGGDENTSKDQSATIAVGSGNTITTTTSEKEVVFTIGVGTDPTVTVTTTAGGGTKIDVKSYTTSDAVYPKTIKGLNTKVKTTVQNDDTPTSGDIVGIALDGATTLASDGLGLLFYDQYSDAFSTNSADYPTFFGISAPSTTGAGSKTSTTNKFYVYTVEDAGNAHVGTEATSDGIDYAGNNHPAAITETYSASLYEITGTNDTDYVSSKKLDDYTFKVTMAAAKFEDYSVSLKDENALLYTGSNSPDVETIVVKAKDASNNEVELTTSQYEAVLRNTSVAGATLDVYNNHVFVDEGVALSGVAKTGKAIVDIYVGGSVAATLEVPVSNADPVVSEIKAVTETKKAYDLTAGVTVTSTGTYKFDATPGSMVLYIKKAGVAAYDDFDYAITAVDQYGMSNFDSIKFAGTNVAVDSAVVIGTGTLALVADPLSQNVKVTNSGITAAETSAAKTAIDALNVQAAAGDSSLVRLGTDDFNAWDAAIQTAVEGLDGDCTYTWGTSRFALNGAAVEGTIQTSDAEDDENEVTYTVSVYKDGYSRTFSGTVTEIGTTP